MILAVLSGIVALLERLVVRMVRTERAAGALSDRILALESSARG